MMKTFITSILILSLTACATTAKVPNQDDDGTIRAPNGAVMFCEEHPTSELCVEG